MLFAVVASPLQAQSVWTSFSSASWSDMNAWSPTGVPTSHDTTHLVFGTGANITATNNLGFFLLNEILFSSQSNMDVTVLDGDELRLLTSSLAELPEIRLTESGSATISSTITYVGNTTVSNSGSGSLLLNGSQLITRGTKQTFINEGSGTLSLADGITYDDVAGSVAGTGVVLNFINNSTSLNAGSFTVGNMPSMGAATFNIGGTGTVTFSGNTSGGLFDDFAVLNVLTGATFDFAGNGESMGALSGAGTINIRGGVGLSLSGYFEVSGKLTGTVAAAITFDGATHTTVLSNATNDYTGATTLTQGKLIINANAPSGSAGALGNATSEVLVGSTSGATNASLLIGEENVTIGRIIRLRSGNTGISTIGGLNDSGTATFSGNVILGTNSTAAKGLTVLSTKGGTVEFTGALQRATGATGTADTLTVTGGGTTVLKGANTFTGATTVSGGTLVLDYTSQNNSKLSQTATLTLNGGSLQVLGNASAVTSQTINGLVLGNSAGTLGGGGRLVVTTSGQNTMLNLGTLTRNRGATMDFSTVQSAGGTARIVTTSGNTPTNILGAYATFNRDDWAVVSGGDIAALNSANYTLGAFGAGLHTSLAASTSAGTGATSHTLRLTDAGAVTFAAAANILTLESGGLLVASSAGATSIGTAAVRGNLVSGTGELIIHQNSTAGALTINSLITGTATVTKTGDGRLILTGANSYSGNTYINGGIVEVTNAASLGAFASGTTNGVFINGGTLVLSAANALTGGTSGGYRQITVGSAGATIDLRADQALSQGNLKGTGTLTKTGTGTLVVGSAQNTFTGDIIIEQGAIVMNSAQLNSAANIYVMTNGSYTITDDGTGTFTLATAGRFVLNGNGYLNNGALRLNDQSTTSASQDPRTTINREVVLETTSRIQVDNGSAVGSYSQLSLTANVYGAGGLVKSGSGGLVLTARDNTYSGATEVQDGLLAIDSGNDRLPTGTTVTLGTGATSGILKLNGYSQTLAGIATSGTGTANAVIGGNAANTSLLEVDVASGSQTYGGSLGGTGTTTLGGNYHTSNNLDFVKSGDGSLQLNAANTYSGDTTVEEGTLSLGNSKALGGAGFSYANTAGITTVKTGAKLDLNGQADVQEVIVLNGTGLNGAGALVNQNTNSTASLGNGVASLTVTSVNATGWAGASSVDVGAPASGTSAIASASFGLGTGSISVTNGGTAFTLSNGAVSVSGGGGTGAVLTLNHGLTNANFVVAAGTTTYSVAPNVTLQNGATGVAILDGNGLVTGINITSPGSSFSGAPTATFTGGTVSFSGTNPVATGNANNFTVVGVNVVNPGTGYTSTPTITITRTGGTTAAAVVDSSKFVLNGFTVTNAGSGYTASPTVTITNSGGTATATATANLTSVYLASDSSVGGDGNLILNPVISGNHALEKVGSGTTTLNGANVYSGTTTVREGILLANNATGSATGTGSVQVVSGATLGGTGSVAGAASQSITTDADSNLIVGSQHGAAEAAQDLVFGDSAIASNVSVNLHGTLQFDLTGAGSFAVLGDSSYNTLGGGNDLLEIFTTGTINLDGATILIAALDTTAWQDGHTWKLIDWSNVPYSSLSTEGVTLGTTTVANYTLTQSITADGYYITAVVPEPGRALLVILGSAVCLFVRRRRC